MKKIILATIAICAATALNASITFNGTSLLNAPSLVDGQQGVYLVSNDGSPFSFSLNAGDALSDSATYGGSFSVIGSESVTAGFGTAFEAGFTFNLGGGITENDAFGVVVFENSSGNLTNGDTYRIWTDPSWTVPADGTTFTFGTELTQLSSAAGSTGTVVPEPSAFALLAGCFGLAWVMVRRRA